MRPTGGYFELELRQGNQQYHNTPHTMKSGRSALHHILNTVKPALVYVPYFTCKVVMEPFDADSIPYKYYEINEDWVPQNLVELGPGEYFLYINYFDVKGKVVALLSEKYGDKLIVDCTGAFFMKGNNISWFFNSCRKFFGVPDGAYIYPPAGASIQIVEVRNEEYICDHLIARFNGHPSEGYESFLRNEILAGHGIAAMSKMSEYLLSNINYVEVAEKRTENYNFLHTHLSAINLFKAEKCDKNVPQYYPLVLDDEEMRTKMIERKIFIGRFWPHIHHSLRPDAYEHYLSAHLLALPVDHRYGLDDMQQIVDVIAMLTR